MEIINRYLMGFFEVVSLRIFNFIRLKKKFPRLEHQESGEKEKKRKRERERERGRIG